ncbi:MAG: hypothetical protein LC803_14525 [Acidobacteria bacterium]|nr:hypothetical protein [Acidobacteriota bacterium]
MSDTVLAAIVGAVAGIITGSIGSLFAPWANWGIEKRREKLAYKRELIAKWRVMVRDITTSHNTNKEILIKLLQEHQDWYSLKPHLTPNTLSIIGIPMIDKDVKSLSETSQLLHKHEKRHSHNDYQTWTDVALNYLIDDIGKIEKKWGLV